MSYTVTKTINLGYLNTGLAGTLGYTVYTNAGVVSQARSTSGVTELGAGTGQYVVAITCADQFSGAILWDNGAASGVAYASDVINDPRVIVLYPIQKDTAFTTFQFPMTLSSDHVSPYTGAGSTVSGIVLLDGVESALTNSGSISAVSGVTGVYMISLSAADMNGNSVCLVFSAPGCDNTKIFWVNQA